MRPIRLKIKGLNSFIEEQEVCFDELTQYGLFGIFGPTGSGKTTILDGITLALYGKVARNSRNFINVNETSASVLFEFQISGQEMKRYRVERDFKQDKKTGTCKSGKCKLTDITEEPEILADKVKTVRTACEDIIGLSCDDFLRTVVLPQGKFSEFLKLEGSSRNEMLERLFQLEDYGDELVRKIKRKQDSARSKMENLEGESKAYQDVDEEILKEKESLLKVISKELLEKQAKEKELERKYKIMENTWNLQNELQQYLKTSDELKVMEGAMKELSRKLVLCEAAYRVVPKINRYQEAAKQHLDVQQQTVEAKENVDAAQKEKQEKDVIWEKCRKDYDVTLPKYREYEQKYQNAIHLKEQLESLEQEKRQLEFELASLEKETLQLKVQAENLKNAEEKSKDIIEKLEIKSINYSVDAELRKSVRDGLTLEQNYVYVKEQYDLVLQTYELNVRLQKDAAIKKENIEQQLFEKEVVEDLDAFQQDIYEMQNKWNQYEGFIKQKDIAEKEILEKEVQLKELETKKKTMEAEVSKLTQKVDDLRIHQLAEELQKKLVEGQPCPVCGSIHHVQGNLQEVSDGVLEQVKIELDAKENEKIIVIEELLKAEAYLSHRKEEMEETKEKIQALGTEFLTHTEEEYKHLMELIPECRKARVEYVNNSTNVENKLLEKTKREADLNIAMENLSTAKEEVGISSFKEKAEELDNMDAAYRRLQETLKKERILFDDSQRKERETSALLSEKKEKSAGKNAELKQKEANQIEKKEEIKKLMKEEQTLEQLNTGYAKVLRSIDILISNFEKSETAKEEANKTYQEKSHLHIQLSGRLAELVKQVEEQDKALKAALIEENFESEQVCMNAVMAKEEFECGQRKKKKYEEDCALNQGLMEKTKEKLGETTLTKKEWDDFQTNRESFIEELENMKKQQGQFNHELEVLKQKWEQVKHLQKELKKAEHYLSQLDDLLKLFRGKRFVEYVAYSKLAYIARAASKRLFDISNGNYGLEIDSDGRFIICDFKNGGLKRDTSTLSGGETFLVSLSLSLALSEQVQLKGTAPLELFFLDEGFGTLDDDLLDVVMDSLEKVQNDKLKVGIISHVESIKARVPVKLLITPSKAGMGGSKINLEKN